MFSFYFSTKTFFWITIFSFKPMMKFDWPLLNIPNMNIYLANRKALFSFNVSSKYAYLSIRFLPAGHMM